VTIIKIVEPTRFDTYVAVKRGAPLSLHVENFIACLRAEMQAINPARNAPAKAQGRPRKT